MRKKLVKIILLLVIAIFSMQIKVNAAVITSTDKQVQSNSGSVTISISSKQALGAFKLKLIDNAGLTLENTTKASSSFELSGDKLTISGSSSDGITNLGSFTFKVPTVMSDTKYNIKFSITGMETTDLEPIVDETNIAVLTVIAETPKDTETNNNTGTTGSTTTTTTTPTEKPAEKPAEVKKSTEARLSKLGIKVKNQKNDFSGFKKDTYQYSTTVANDVSEVEIYAEKADSKATVKGTGKVSLKEGDNKFEVKVTAEDGKTTKTYKITIKRKTVEEEDAENGEARLKTLGIKPKEYDFTGFNSDTTEYTAKVPNEIKEIEIFATAKDSRAQITGIGVVELKEGINDLKIEVIAVNGEKNIYNLKVTREEPEVPFGLSTLNIDGLKLTPSFEVDTYEYNVELKEDLAKLEIQAKSNDEDATVEIIGNEELKDGENVITIQVRNKEKNKIATYQIIVNKNVIVEEVVAQTSWLKPSTWGKEEIFKLAIILVLIVLIICAILLKISIGKENKKTKKVDFPGGEELDKAIAEHQELSEEPAQVEYIEEKVPEINYQAEVQKEEIQQNYIEEIAMNRFEEKDLEKKTRRRGRHF